MASLYKNAAGLAYEAKTLLMGIQAYRKSGEANVDAWTRLLKRHCETNGRSSDRAATVLRMFRKPRQPSPIDSALGHFTIEDQRSIADELRRDGYYVFPTKLPAAFCDALEEFASKTPASVEGKGADRADRVIFDPTAPISKTYKIVMDDLVAAPTMQRLIADPLFLCVAEQYLEALPILCGAAMWWSPTYGDEPGAEAAQQFHFDFDGAPSWLKYFVYLTDVGPKNGPHVFVRASHLSGHEGAKEIVSRGYARIPDDDIDAAYGAENVVEICGKRGTVLAVDTRGFHKGKMPETGNRLIAQLFFSLPQFNLHAPRQPLPEVVDPALASLVDRLPKVFERFPATRPSP